MLSYLSIYGSLDAVMKHDSREVSVKASEFYAKSTNFYSRLRTLENNCLLKARELIPELLSCCKTIPANVTLAKWLLAKFELLYSDLCTTTGTTSFPLNSNPLGLIVKVENAKRIVGNEIGFHLQKLIVRDERFLESNKPLGEPRMLQLLLCILALGSSVKLTTEM